MTYFKQVILAFIDAFATALPQAVRKTLAKGFVVQRVNESGLQIALYDPKLDILRFPEPGESMELLGEGYIADSVPWMQKLRTRLPHGGIFFDVGGFRGITTQFFAKYADQVHTFEPMPENVQSIKQVLNVRKISNVSVHQIALSNKQDTSDFHIYEIKGHNSLGKVQTFSKYSHTIKVPTATLDVFAEEHSIEHIDFLKIDVEGFELEVLQGAQRLLAEGKIGTILFESNLPVLASIGKKIAPVYELLQTHGYMVSNLEGAPVSLQEVEEVQFGDFLAYPEKVLANVSLYQA